MERKKERKKERKEETIGKNSISLLIRWLNYAEDLAKICQCFRKAHVRNFKGNYVYMYNARICVYVYEQIFRTAGCCCETHLSLRKKKPGEKTLKERRTMDATYEYGEPVTFKPLRRV